MRGGEDEAGSSIAIAGGGIIGLATAWRLAQLGWRVTVFDRGAIGGEASWAGAGMLSLGGEFVERSALASLAMESRQMYPWFISKLQNESGLVIDFQECGALDLAYSDETADELRYRAARQKEIGIASKLVNARQVQTFWPRVRSDGLRQARLYPDDAIVDPREAVTALTRACRKRHVSIMQDCGVGKVTPADESIRVVTEAGKRSFAAVVIAAGAWSGFIQVEGMAPLPPSEPVKGHLIAYQQPPQTCNTILRHGHTYLLQRANGLLIAGTSIERKGFDVSISSRIAKELSRRAAEILPHLAEIAPSYVWTGLRPASDALHIGPWRGKRCYLAYGHYRNGILLAPVTAERIAEEITANLGRRSFGSAAHHG